MTTKILTGTYADGYSIQAPITTLSVGATGYVTGAGIYSAPGGLGGAYTIVNTGRINGYVGHRAGVYLQGGGMITNGARGDTTALLEGDAQGIVSESLATVVNYGTITSKNVGPGAGGIGMLLYSGVVTNGVAAGKGGGGDTTALIHGYYDAILFSGAAGTVTNYGSITAAATGDSIAAHGVITLREGGRVTNGSAADTTALIDAYSGTGVTAGGGSVVNNGTIAGAGSATGQYGVLLTYGASLTNGSLADHVALIEGYTAVAAQGAASNVTNYGSIISTAGLGQGLVNRTGVDLYNGALTNGAAADTAAFIKGYDGVDVSGAGTVTNFGAIDGADGADGYYGVVFAKGGRLTNGSTLSQSALIAGTGGAGFKAGEGTVANFGTIQATGAGDFGVAMYGGLVTNGALADENARIDGPGGVSFAAAGTAINFGTVEADGGVGVKLFKGGRIVNGSAADQNAVIEATLGVYATGGATTLINYGVINGAGGTAVQFMSSADVLVVETSSNILGDVLGGGGSLGLACGGTISGVAGGDVTVSGGVPTKTFTDFGTVILGAGKVFTLSGPGTVIGGQTLDVAGALGVSTALGGAGTLAVTGVATFNAGTSLTLAKITMAGAGAAVNVDTSLAYAGSWNQSAGTLSVATGDKLTFTGTGDHFAGTVAGAGTVAFTAGSDTLAAATLSVANLIISTATIALSGTIDLTGKVYATTPSLLVAGAGASLTGGGTLTLTNTATNRFYGVSATATLTNVDDRIVGAGQLGAGQMTLVNEAGGVIEGDASIALTLNTGGATIANAGLIEAVGVGETVIKSAIANTGKLWADGGTLLLDGAVTGAGTGYIDGGTLDAAAAFTQNVVFNGPTGVLQLAHAQAYAGTITGFSKTGATALDLADIAFTAGTTKATYVGTTTSGTLTVTDGTHTAKIKLAGNYIASTFTVSSDGHGGTTVVDPTKTTAAALPLQTPHAFIAAMASLGAGGPAAVRPEPWRDRQPALLAAGQHIA